MNAELDLPNSILTFKKKKELNIYLIVTLVKRKF